MQSWSDIALSCSIALVALCIRIPHLTTTPTLSSDAEEIRWAVLIARSATHPLTNIAPYIGAWHSYVMAAAFRLLGFDLAVARGLTLSFAVLTTVLVYWLARELGLTPAGAAAAAGLLAASGSHTVVASHLGWSNCTTPFYTTLVLLLCVRAVRRRQPVLLLGAGLVGGLALQTHPTALPLLVAAAIYVGWRQRAQRLRWLAPAFVLLVVAYSPVLLANALGAGAGLSAGEAKVGAYQKQRPLSATTYAEDLTALAQGLDQVLAGRLVPGDAPLRDPALLLAGVFGLGALLWATPSGRWLLPLGVLLTVLSLPALTPRYELLNGRYLMPLLPVILAAEAGLLEALGRWAVPRALSRGLSWPRRLVGGATLLGLTVLLGWSLVSPLWQLNRLYAQEPQPAFNDVLRGLAEQVEAARRPGEMVFLDRQVHVIYPFDRAGKPVRAAMILRMLLDLRSQPNRYVSVAPETLRRELSVAPGHTSLLLTQPAPQVEALSPTAVAKVRDIRLPSGQRIVLYRVSAHLPADQ